MGKTKDERHSFRVFFFSCVETRHRLLFLSLVATTRNSSVASDVTTLRSRAPPSGAKFEGRKLGAFHDALVERKRGDANDALYKMRIGYIYTDKC